MAHNSDYMQLKLTDNRRASPPPGGVIPGIYINYYGG